MLCFLEAGNLIGQSPSDHHPAIPLCSGRIPPLRTERIPPAQVINLPQSGESLSPCPLVAFEVSLSLSLSLTNTHTPSLWTLNMQSFQWLRLLKNMRICWPEETCILSSAKVSKARNDEGRTYGNGTAGGGSVGTALQAAVWPSEVMLRVVLCWEHGGHFCWSTLLTPFCLVPGGFQATEVEHSSLV